MPVHSISDPIQHLKDRILNEHEVNDKGCWIWTGPVMTCNKTRPKPLKYGQFWMKTGPRRWQRRIVLAHQASAIVFLGYKFTSGKQVNHKCGNSLCVNPEHLYLGTQKENVADSIREGTYVQADRWGKK